MPLTEKGKEIKRNMIKQYGREEGKRVFYAAKNKGSITGVDSKSDDNQHMGFEKGDLKPIEKLAAQCDSLSARLDMFEKRQAMKKAEPTKPKTKDNMQPSNRHPKEVSG